MHIPFDINATQINKPTRIWYRDPTGVKAFVCQVSRSLLLSTPITIPSSVRSPWISSYSWVTRGKKNTVVLPVHHGNGCNLRLNGLLQSWGVGSAVTLKANLRNISDFFFWGGRTSSWVLEEERKIGWWDVGYAGVRCDITKYVWYNANLYIRMRISQIYIMIRII